MIKSKHPASRFSNLCKFIFDKNLLWFSWIKRFFTIIGDALFNFQSLLQVILLLICTCTYIHATWPTLLDKNRTGLLGIFWKFARIGERLSPYVAISCLIMAFNVLRS